MYIQEDKVNLVTRTEILKRFSKEVLETTTCQSKEIADLKAEGMESSSLRVVCFPCQLRGGGEATRTLFTYDPQMASQNGICSMCLPLCRLILTYVAFRQNVIICTGNYYESENCFYFLLAASGRHDWF